MVNLGSLEQWQYAANPLCLKGALKEVCLWIDSFDLALEGKKQLHKRDQTGHTRRMALYDHSR